MVFQDLTSPDCFSLAQSESTGSDLLVSSWVPVFSQGPQKVENSISRPRDRGNPGNEPRSLSVSSWHEGLTDDFVRWVFAFSPRLKWRGAPGVGSIQRFQVLEVWNLHIFVGQSCGWTKSYTTLKPREPDFGPTRQNTNGGGGGVGLCLEG